jgi:hypothetical protein
VTSTVALSSKSYSNLYGGTPPDVAHGSNVSVVAPVVGLGAAELPTVGANGSGVFVGDGLGDGVGVSVNVGVGVGVTVDVGVGVCVAVAVLVAVALGVDVDVGVDVAVGAAVAVGVFVDVAVAVGPLPGSTWMWNVCLLNPPPGMFSFTTTIGE